MSHPLLPKHQPIGARALLGSKPGAGVADHALAYRRAAAFQRERGGIGVVNPVVAMRRLIDGTPTRVTKSDDAASVIVGKGPIKLTDSVEWRAWTKFPTPISADVTSIAVFGCVTPWSLSGTTTDPGSDGAIYLNPYLVLVDFDPATLCWNNQPGAGDLESMAAASVLMNAFSAETGSVVSTAPEHPEWVGFEISAAIEETVYGLAWVAEPGNLASVDALLQEITWMQVLLE